MMICRQLIFLVIILLNTSVASLADQRNLQVSFSFIPTLDCITAGFRLYDDNENKICEVVDPAATVMTCPDVEITGSEAVFTLTSFCDDGRESCHSAPFTIAVSSEEVLSALIQADPVSGAPPLAVTLDAGSSTGAITNYHWEFGDGEAPVDDIMVTHQFVFAGVYTVTLTVTENTGAVSTVQQIITVTENSSENHPPIAVISASTSVGNNPLAVIFDGTGSSDVDNNLLHYTWDFGDGSRDSSNTPLVTHTYVVAGTYRATLTVSDGIDQTTSRAIPVIVSGSNPEEIGPTATFSTNHQSKTIPVQVNFDGSASTSITDNGTIIQYDWNVGDGSTGTGQSSSHVFVMSGNYTVSLKVTDSAGSTDVATAKIIVTEKNSTGGIMPLSAIYSLLLLNNNKE